MRGIILLSMSNTYQKSGRNFETNKCYHSLCELCLSLPEVKIHQTLESEHRLKILLNKAQKAIGKYRQLV